MAAAPAIAAIVTAVAAVAGGTYQAIESRSQRRDAEREARKTRTAQEKALSDQRRREQADRERAAQEQRRREGVLGAQGLRDTILTGPLGLTGTGAPKSGKTLLGS